MLSELPEPRHSKLVNAPLELVVWQVQFAEPAPFSAPAIGEALVTALASHGRFQLARNTPGIVIGFGAAAPGGAEPDGWQLRQGQVSISVASGGVSVETAAYETWSELRALVELVMATLAGLADVPGEARLGLRFVDRITLPNLVKKPQDWNTLLAAWLASPLAHPQLGDSVLALSGQVDLQVDETVRATIRHRVFSDFDNRGRHTAILDFDTFRNGYRVFDADALLGASDDLCDVAHRLFESSVTRDLYAAFEGESS